MGIMNFLKKQLIDVLEWTEPADGILAFKYPMQDNEIQVGGKLTVRDSQLALFVNEGQIADVFKPGLHTLNTQNLPILTNLRNWDKGFNSPFKSDVYFYSTREQLGLKWGTPTAITIRDKEFGAIRLRAYGSYSFTVADPKTFYQKASGTRDLYTVEDLEVQLRALVATEIGSFLVSGEIAFLDMAANQVKFSQALQVELKPAFAQYGLELRTFTVQSVSLPDEVQAYLDKGSQMRILGDLQKYAQFQAADSISTAAKNEGGLAGVGVGLGAGAAIGQAMSQALGQQSSTAGSAGGAAAASAAAGGDPVGTLNQLHELMKAGILTQAEFDAKKAEILKKI